MDDQNGKNLADTADDSYSYTEGGPSPAELGIEHQSAIQEKLLGGSSKLLEKTTEHAVPQGTTDIDEQNLENVRDTITSLSQDTQTEGKTTDQLVQSENLQNEEVKNLLLFAESWRNTERLWKVKLKNAAKVMATVTVAMLPVILRSRGIELGGTAEYLTSIGTNAAIGAVMGSSGEGEGSKTARIAAGAAIGAGLGAGAIAGARVLDEPSLSGVFASVDDLGAGAALVGSKVHEHIKNKRANQSDESNT